MRLTYEGSTPSGRGHALLRGAGGYVFLPALLLVTWLAARAYAADEVTAAELARSHGLSYTLLDTGPLRACKMSGKGLELILSSGLRTALVNGIPRHLGRPPRWDGRNLLLARHDAEMLAGRLGKPADSSAASLGLRPARRRAFKVVIDPGHGGRDPGAVYGGLAEKDINLDIALRLARSLRAEGVQVILTRTTDKWVDLDERVRIANRAAPDLFISVHANAVRRNARAVSGAMTIYPPRGARGGKPDLDDRAKAAFMEKEIRPATFGAAGAVSNRAMLAVARTALESYRWMSKAAAMEIQRHLAPVVGTVERNDGIIEDWRGLRVLSRVRAPAVLVEVDYLSNPSRARKLGTSSYRARIARAIGEAVMAFLRKTTPGGA